MEAGLGIVQIDFGEPYHRVVNAAFRRGGAVAGRRVVEFLASLVVRYVVVFVEAPALCELFYVGHLLVVPLVEEQPGPVIVPGILVDSGVFALVVIAVLGHGHAEVLEHIFGGHPDSGPAVLDAERVQRVAVLVIVVAGGEAGLHEEDGASPSVHADFVIVDGEQEFLIGVRIGAVVAAEEIGVIVAEVIAALENLLARRYALLPHSFSLRRHVSIFVNGGLVDLGVEVDA